MDSNVNFTIQAISGIPTLFNSLNNTTLAGYGGSGDNGGTDGSDGSALGNSIFLRTGSTLTLKAEGSADVLTLGNEVSFADDSNFGASGTSVFVKGNGTVIYNGNTDYKGSIKVDTANFQVHGQITQAAIQVCRNIAPESLSTLTLGSLSLHSADLGNGIIGSLVPIEINSNNTSSVAVNGAASLAGILEIDLKPNAQPGLYTIISASGISGTFDSVRFTNTLAGTTPLYTLTYTPTTLEFNFLGFPPSVDIPATVNGSPIINPAVVCCGRPIILGPLPVAGSGPTTYTVTNQTGTVHCQIKQTASQTYLKIYGSSGSCTIVGTKDGIVSNPLTVTAA